MFDSYLSLYEGPIVPGLEKEQELIAEHQPEYITLPSLRAKRPERQTLSRWTFTDQQRQEILDGADLYLEVLTFGGAYPPVRISVASQAEIKRLLPPRVAEEYGLVLLHDPPPSPVVEAPEEEADAE